MDYNSLKNECLGLYRTKNYSDSLDKYLELKGKFQELTTHFEDRRKSDEKRNILGNILACFYHLIKDKNQVELVSDFEKIIQEYLEITKKYDDESLKEWADNLLQGNFGYVLEIILLKHSKVDALKRDVKSYVEKFINTFERGGFKPKLFYDRMLDIMYTERRNQNYLQTSWLIEVFLELTGGKEEFRRNRSDVMSLMADVIFFSDMEDNDHEFSKAKKSLEWLDKSIHEYGNKFAEERKAQLISDITAKEQINRFWHDAGSKIGTMQEMVRDLKRDTNIPQKTVLDIEKHIDFMLNTLRLTRKENPKFDMSEIERVFDFFQKEDVSFELLGETKRIKTDIGYVKIILDNLITNSREAYIRNNLTGSVYVTFDFRSKLLSVKDLAGGIPEKLQEQDKLFEPYISSKGIRQNCGLGLFRVKDACKLLNADLSYEVINEHGLQGTVFKIQFKEIRKD